MLFFEKENVFMCLAVTKFVLRKINSDVWFIQTFLQKIKNPAKETKPSKRKWINSTLIHKRNKTQQKNSSNPVKLRSRGGGEDEIARWSDIERRRDQYDHPTISSIAPLVDRQVRLSISIVDCAARRTIAIKRRDRIARSHRLRSSNERRDRRSVLSDLGSLFSLSLSLIWAL